MARHCDLAITILAIVAVFGVGAVSLRADSFVVNSTADQVDANIGNGVCATAGGTCTLRAAIQEANALPGPHEIVLPAGVFYLTIPAAGPDDASTGDLNILHDVTIRGAGRDVTIIDGLGAARVFNVAAAPVPGIQLTVTDMTIRNGDSGGGAGGAVLHPGPGGLSVARVRFLNNRGNSGGAIGHGGADARTIADCVFEDNNAIGGPGGAILVSVGGPASVTNVLNCVFTADTATASGGAIACAVFGPAPLVIDHCSFRDCQSLGGGGAVDAPINAQVDVSNSEFVGNVTFGAGGAVKINSPGPATVKLTADRFVSNAASNTGGACQVSVGGDLTISGCHVADNTAGSSGGGIAYSSALAGNLVVENSDFVSNRCQTALGGGLYASLPGVFSLVNVDVTDNQAATGGGGVYIANRLQATITDSRFTGNSSTLTAGGGMVDAAGAGVLTISGCSFSGNTVGGGVGSGGGLRCTAAGNVAISNTTFSYNEATGLGSRGGGISCSAGPNTQIMNCTFSGNSASAFGGAAHCSSPMTFTNCTFAQNSAVSGAGATFFAAAAVTVQNCIVGTPLAGVSCGGGPLTSGGHNIDQVGTCGFAVAGDQNGVDPRLGPLQNNGGRTLTHALLAGSPAVNAGGAGVCPATDQRGLPRTACDIGAFEVVSDCNNNGQDDTAEVVSGATPDCNHNGIPDSCDIAAGLSADCDGNGVPDGCQTDSNGNGVIDACEPAPAGSSGPCGVCGMGVGMMMPLMLLSLAWIKRRIR